MENRLENEKQASDRRMFERIPVDFQLKYRNSTQDTAGVAFCSDISASGAGVYFKDRLDLNDKLDLWLEVPGKTDPVHLGGEVVWLKETQPQVWRSGIEFREVRLMDLAIALRALNR